jgi:adenine-specific DNA methylase
MDQEIVNLESSKQDTPELHYLSKKKEKSFIENYQRTWQKNRNKVFQSSEESIRELSSSLTNKRKLIKNFDNSVTSKDCKSLFELIVTDPSDSDDNSYQEKP